MSTQTPDQHKTLEDAANSFFAQTPEQPRGEDGKFAPAPDAAPTPDAAPPAAPDAPPPSPPADAAPSAPPETPAQPPAPSAKKLQIKVNHEVQEIDLDAEYADEQRRAALAEKIRKGTAFDEVTQKERQRGQREALEFFREQGYSVVQDPQTGQYRVVPPTPQVPTPAAKAEVPPPDIDDLERRASEGDAAALVELNRIARSEASQAREAIKQRQEQEAQAQAEARQREALRQYIDHCGNAINQRISGLGLGDDAHGKAIAEHLRRSAAAHVANGARIEDALEQIGQGAAPYIELRRQAQAAAQPSRQAPAAPPPVIPAASGAASAAGTKKKAQTLEQLAAEMGAP